MSHANLRFSTDILRRLGEELNQSFDQGILELVKNAYDANARECVIELIDTHELGGTVRVSDDGDGMTREQIEDGWLLLGRSSKSIQEPTRLGRLPAGNKGLGRLAALRMGDTATLLTRPLGAPQDEFQLEIAWQDFDAAEAVDEVILNIQHARRQPKVEQGTSITISGLGSRLKRSDVKSLARATLLLADPFADNPLGFQPVLRAPEFQDLEKLVQGRYFDDAEFHLVAQINVDGQAQARVEDWKGNTLFSADHQELRRKLGEAPYSCPPSRFDLWVFILDGKTFSSRATTSSEVKTWLREFGGVHLYVRGLRVAPYGNPGDDWLGINLRRVQSPEFRPGTNSSIGRISLEDTEEKLLPKTDRTGIVEGEAFQELRLFATDALEWLGRRRRDEGEKRRATQRGDTAQKMEQARTRLQEAVRTLTAVPSVPPQAKKEFETSLKSYSAESERDAQNMRREVQLYRTLSTAGIAQAVLAHEAKHPMEVIHDSAQTVEKRGRKLLKEKYKDLEDPVERIMRQARMMSAYGNVTLKLVERGKRRSGKVEVHKAIQHILKMLEPLLQKSEVQVDTTFAPGSPYLRTSEAALESVVANLLVNSLKAFQEAQIAERRIFIQTEITSATLTDQVLTLQVTDSGPGLQGIDVQDVWIAGETTYPDGTGLGLAIVRDTVRDLGGRVEARVSGSKTVGADTLSGAQFTVYLPILGA